MNGFGFPVGFGLSDVFRQNPRRARPDRRSGQPNSAVSEKQEMPYDISENKRDWYREVSSRSRARKKAAANGELPYDLNNINKPALQPKKLMPQRPKNGLRALSLFSGGGMPEAFVAENVPGLLDPKFRKYVDEIILSPLTPDYHIIKFKAVASDFGVPQVRTRVIFVGFRSPKAANSFQIPEPTHLPQDSLFSSGRFTLGAREALGLKDIGFDCFSPTLRSGFTGPRKSTSILNSKASQQVWEKLHIWPNGVQKSRADAVMFPPENGHFRLSVQDCAILQGFPEDWIFQGATYQILGQIGNSVCPPVAYAIARSVSKALGV